MKKLNLLLAGVILASASPALALFENGDFETGDFTGWILDYGWYWGGGSPIVPASSSSGARADSPTHFPEAFCL